MYANPYVTASHGLPVPYTTTISPPLSNGTQIHITGTPTGNRFEVNLKNQDDIALHFNPRFDSSTVVLNSLQRGAWGSEERHNLPFQRGVRFTLVITATNHGFNISVNNSPLCEFHQRLPSYSAQLLEIKGDISLESAQVYGGGFGGGFGGPVNFPQMGTNMPYVQPSNVPFNVPGFNANVGFSSTPNIPHGHHGHHGHHVPQVPSVPSYPTGGTGIPTIQSCRIHTGSRIFVRGYIHPNANRFEINLLQGYSDGDDIAFHFNPRFDQHKIVKNHRQNGQWGFEDNQPFPAFMPLAAGVQIDLQIACLPDRYTVYMNNHLIAEYHHKISPGSVQAIQYKGDITLTSVGQL